MKQGNTESYAFALPSVEPGGSSRDGLMEILRQGVQDMLGQAVRNEVARNPAERSDLLDADGHQQVVRSGDLPERKVMTGIGGPATAGAGPAVASVCPIALLCSPLIRGRSTARRRLL